jgi:hypothetical protein
MKTTSYKQQHFKGISQLQIMLGPVGGPAQVAQLVSLYLLHCLHSCNTAFVAVLLI